MYMESPHYAASNEPPEPQKQYPCTFSYFELFGVYKLQELQIVL
jgi:hypothetical protein